MEAPRGFLSRRTRPLCVHNFTIRTQCEIMFRFIVMVIFFPVNTVSVSEMAPKVSLVPIASTSIERKSHLVTILYVDCSILYIINT